MLDLQIQSGALRAECAQGGGPGGPAWGRRDERRLMRRSIHSLGPPDTAFHLALSAALRGEEGAPRADRLPLRFGPWTDASRKPPSPDPPTPGNVQGPVPRSRTGQIWCGGGVDYKLISLGMFQRSTNAPIANNRDNTNVAEIRWREQWLLIIFCHV